MVGDIITDQKGCMMSVGTHSVRSHEVVLATNAYQQYNIQHAPETLPIEQVRGYMAGYVIPGGQAPKTICYEPPGNAYTE